MLERAVPMPQTECERLLEGVLRPEETGEAELVETPTVGTALLDLVNGSSGLKGRSGGGGLADVKRRGAGRLSRAARSTGDGGDE